MNAVKRFFSLTVAVLCLLTVMGCVNRENQDDGDFQSDVSEISQNQKDFEKLTVIFTGNAIASLDKDGGAIPVCAINGLRKSISAKGEEVILLDTGGSLWGTDFAQADSGKSAARLLNEMGYTAMAAAKDDFNLDMERLSYLSHSGDMKIMSSNCIIKDTNTPFSEGGILIDKAGAKIGILGFSPVETENEVNPLNIGGAVFEKDEVILEAMVNNLKENGADYIIALTSLSKEDELNPELLAQTVNGIDVVIGRGKSNPSASFSNVGDTFVVYSDSTMKSVGILEIDLKEKTRGIKSFTYDSDILLSLCDSETEAFKDELLKEQEAFLNEDVCEIESDGEYDYNVNGEIPFLSAVASSMRPITGAQASFLRWSSIKDLPQNGYISKKNILEIIDAETLIVTKTLNGAQILMCLETSFKDYPKYNPDFLIFSGITLDFNGVKEAGERIENVEINGEKLSLEKEYEVALDSSLLSSESVYEILKDTDAKNCFGLLSESVYRYFKALNKDGKLILKKASAINLLSEVNMDDEKSGNEEPKQKDESVEDNQKEEKLNEEIINEPPVQKTKTYEVQLGDSLVKISIKLYGTSDFWDDILELNRDIIKNPNDIRVGMELKLPQ